MTDQEAQKIWDACLIKGWREFKELWKSMSMFEGMTGKKLDDFELLRTPQAVPWEVGVRVFVAQRLPKINDWLYTKGPEHDIALLRSLQASKYTTASQNLNPDRARERARRHAKKDMAFIALNTEHYRNRNQATDWGVTK